MGLGLGFASTSRDGLASLSPAGVVRLAVLTEPARCAVGLAAAGARHLLLFETGALAAAGATYEDVVKTTIMLADMSDFKTVNAIYGKRFPENSPARATIEAKGLPLGALVEIDAIAVVDA